MTNKELLKQYKDAILTFNADKVEALLNQGVSVNMRIEHDHPLNWLMNTDEETMSDFLFGIDREDLANELPTGINFKIAARKTVNVLLDNGIKLFGKTNDDTTLYNGEHFLVDDLLLTDNKEALVDIALHTIKQSIDAGVDPYQFLNYGFYNRNIKQYINTSLEDFTAVLEEKLYAMQEFHDAVAMRLADPKSEIEYELATEYASNIQYWKDTFEAPHVDDVVDNINYIGEKYFENFVKEVQAANISKAKHKVGVDVSLQKMKRDGDVYILPEEKPQDVLRDLDTLVGLEKEKKAFLKWAIEISKKDESDPEEAMGYSSAYLGNPGTAKTTLFRLKARFLHSMGLVGDKYREVTAGDLEAGYVGQTAIKTKKVLQSCDILFIDEAYALAKEYSSTTSFGQEAVDEIVAYTENNRNMPIFFAGYPGDMQRLFQMNAGLQSRVSKVDIIDDYSIENLVKIFDIGVKDRGYKGVNDDAKVSLAEDLEFHKKKMGKRSFANGREIRNILDDLNGIVKERYYRLESELESGKDLADIFTSLSSKRIVKRKDMVITIDDIKALNLREKHKNFNNNVESEKEPIGFKPPIEVANDTKKKEKLVAAQAKISDFNASAKSNVLDFPRAKKEEEPYIPYKSTRIGFTA